MRWESLRRKLLSFHSFVGSNILAALVLFAFLGGLTLFASIAISNRHADPTEESGRRASSEVRRYGRAKKPLVSLLFRGDVGMDPLMRAAVDRATVDMTRVSCGMAKVDVVWNYRRDEDLPRAALGGDSVVQAISVADVAGALGREDANDLLGITRAAKNPRWNPVWVFLVVERLDVDAELAEWTALHEFGHALGMDHVKIGLMEAHAPLFFWLEEQPEWSVEDQDEFCRIYKCDATAFVKCSISAR